MLKMRTLKRMLMLVLIINTIFILNNIKLFGLSSDDGSASYEITNTKSSFTTEYSNYVTDIGTTVYNSISYSQQVHVFSQTQTENSRVVTWAKADDSGKLVRCPVAAICSDYEATHEDWVVVGAINADQYTTGFGTDIGGLGKDYYYPQPYYPMICDNEGWFVMTGMPVNGGQNICGIYNDGRVDPLNNGSANLNHGNVNYTGMYLYVLDEIDNRLEKFEVNKFNESPRVNETTVWTSHFNDKEEFPEINVTGNVYVVEDAIRAYSSNSIEYTYKDRNAQDAFFGKGYITSVCKEAKIGYGDFAITTEDENVIKALNKGTKIMVQYELDNDFSSCISAIGYHTIQRMNDTDGTISASNTYNTRQYPRAIIGRKANGEIVLMCIDGIQATKEYCGANFWEINAMLKTYGVVEAYQMDGGGSATAVIKNEKGAFETVNSPSDGQARSIFSALLLVERKTPEAQLEVNELLDSGVKLDVNLLDHGRDIKSVLLKIDNKELNIATTTINIELEHNKEYNYEFIIEENDGTMYNINGVLNIPLRIPFFNNCIEEINDNISTFSIDIIDTDHLISSYYLQVKGIKYYPNNDNTIIINDLYSIDTIVYLYYEYEYDGKTIKKRIVYPQSILKRENENIYSYLNNMILSMNVFN